MIKVSNHNVPEAFLTNDCCILMTEFSYSNQCEEGTHCIFVYCCDTRRLDIWTTTSKAHSKQLNSKPDTHKKNTNLMKTKDLTVYCNLFLLKFNLNGPTVLQM